MVEYIHREGDAPHCCHKSAEELFFVKNRLLYMPGRWLGPSNDLVAGASGLSYADFKQPSFWPECAVRTIPDKQHAEPRFVGSCLHK